MKEVINKSLKHKLASLRVIQIWGTIVVLANVFTRFFLYDGSGTSYSLRFEVLAVALLLCEQCLDKE